MTTKYFDINKPGYSIKCKIYCEAIREVEHVIVFAHGFGGHKDNKAAEHFADSALAKMKKTAVLVFDLPCHGKDVRKNLTLQDCDTYFTMVFEYIQNEMKVKDICVYATSFGGYLTLKYVHDHGMGIAGPSDSDLQKGSESAHGANIRRVALRCPAIAMYEVMQQRVLTPENKELLDKGKPVTAGFDRKVLIDQAFLDSIEEADIREWEYLDYADNLLILHGTKDEIIPPEVPKHFADDNVIEFIEIEGADHRFQDLDKMKLAHSHIIEFLR